MGLTGSGQQGMPRVPEQKDLRTRRALRRLAGTPPAGGSGAGGATVQRGTYATLPPPGNAGTLYFASDINILLYDTGTAWQAIGPQLSGVNLPQSSAFTWLNQGVATVDFSRGAMVLQAFGDGNNAWHFAGQAMPYPSVPWGHFTQFTFNAPVGSGCYSNGGVFFYDSTTGAFMTFGVGWEPDTGAVIRIERWTNFTTTAADVLVMAMPPFNGPPWLGYQDDGTARNYLYSADGSDFMRIYTEANNANSIVADTIGMCIVYYGIPSLNQITLTVYGYN